MNNQLILLHEEALSINHPVFAVAPKGTKAIYIWDNNYFNQTNYSLKRLVFIYESLCELPIDIIHGDLIENIKELELGKIYIPTTNNYMIKDLINKIKLIASVELVDSKPFVNIDNSIEFRRFFQYWNKAEKIAFNLNGEC